MSDIVKRVEYFHTEVKDQPGEGFRLLGSLKEHGVTLISCTAFPTRWGKTKVTMVPKDSEALIVAAKAANVPLSVRKTAFLVQGQDRPGAMAEALKRLADAKVNVTSSNATVSQDGTFGMILWVKPKDVEAAARCLSA